MTFGLLRVVLGALCVLFAFPLGRSAMRYRKGQERLSTLLGWGIRALITAAAVTWQAGFDRITTGVFVLAILSFAGGVYIEWRPRHQEQLEKIMFPND